MATAGEGGAGTSSDDDNVYACMQASIRKETFLGFDESMIFSNTTVC